MKDNFWINSLAETNDFIIESEAALIWTKCSNSFNLYIIIEIIEKFV